MLCWQKWQAKSYTYQCVDRSRHNRMCALKFDQCARLALVPLIPLCLEQSTHLYVYFLLILLAIPTKITFWKCVCVLYSLDQNLMNILDFFQLEVCSVLFSTVYRAQIALHLNNVACPTNQACRSEVHTQEKYPQAQSCDQEEMVCLAQYRQHYPSGTL